MENMEINNVKISTKDRGVTEILIIIHHYLASESARLYKEAKKQKTVIAKAKFNSIALGIDIANRLIDDLIRDLIMEKEQ